MRSAYAIRRPVVNAYLVRERDRRRQRELRGWCCSPCWRSAAASWPTPGSTSRCSTPATSIDALERQLRELTRDERQLRLEASYLASPQQIERRAVEELGMQPPALEQVVFWEELP